MERPAPTEATPMSAEDRELLNACATCLRVRHYSKPEDTSQHEPCAAEIDPTMTEERLACSREMARTCLPKALMFAQ